MTEFHATDLPAFQEWSRRFDPPAVANAYLGEHLSVTAASLYMDLLFPHMMLVRDCVLLADRYDPATFEERWASTGGDHNAVERALNRLRLWDVFEPHGDLEVRAVEELASHVADTWSLHAKRLFPDRGFFGEVTDEHGPTVILSSRTHGR